MLHPRGIHPGAQNLVRRKNDLLVADPGQQVKQVDEAHQVDPVHEVNESDDNSVHLVNLVHEVNQAIALNSLQ